MRKSANVNPLTCAGVTSSTSSRNGVAHANPVRCPNHSLSMLSVSVSSLVLMRSLIRFLKSFMCSFPEKVILFLWSLLICPWHCAMVTPAAGCCGAAPPPPAMFISCGFPKAKLKIFSRTFWGMGPDRATGRPVNGCTCTWRGCLLK